MSIRKENPGDIEKIRDINIAAFKTDAEARLVNALRVSGVAFMSLVFEQNDDLLGHIFFTPVEFEDEHPGVRLMGLAPMAVLPGHQNSGIGSTLVKEGIQKCMADSYDAIVVLGHPEFYTRFGFRPSVEFGIKSEYDVPDEVFMVLELRKNSLDGINDIVKFNAKFASL
jgi:putative acetyltransferase